MFAGILAVHQEPFNGKDNCFACNDGDIYKNAVVDKVHSLTQLALNEFGTSKFTISEIEMWEVTFE